MSLRSFGNNSRQGTYALFIALSKELGLSFGKFLKGKSISLEPGIYLYIGSALGENAAAMPLARRLVRHASRSGGKAPHKIRNEMICFFQENNLATKDFQPPPDKKLHWHIDYLLDSLNTQILKAYIIRSPLRMETAVSDMVLSLDETFVIARKLGAGDTRSGTHLVGISNFDSCLAAFEKNIPELLSGKK